MEYNGISVLRVGVCLLNVANNIGINLIYFGSAFASVNMAVLWLWADGYRQALSCDGARENRAR